MPKRKRILIVVCTAALFLIGVGIFVGVIFFSPMSTPAYVAHQGYSESNPGNTPLAFSAAANKDFWGMETDIRFTLDGVPVCQHDADVRFEDDSALAVAEHTYAELRAKPLKNKKTAARVYLCPFTEYLDICAAGGKVAVIELKTVCSPAELTQLLTLVDLHHSRQKSVFISFEYENMTALRAIDGTIARQYLSETKDDPHFEDCLKDGVSLDVKYNLVTKSLVKKFHNKGLSVNAWTVNSDWYRNKMRRMGVDFITSDRYYKD